MSFVEWIFGKSHEHMIDKAKDQCLSQTQAAVDVFHGQMLHICGPKKKECEECWGDIAPERQHFFNKCKNYERRSRAREAMHEACHKIMEEFEQDMDKAFIESFNFLLRPLARWYVSCGGLKKARKRFELMIESASKAAVIALISGTMLGGPLMDIADAKRRPVRIAFKTSSRRHVAKLPSAGAGSVLLGAGTGAVVEATVGEMGYDASRPEEKERVPVNAWPQMSRTTNKDGGCGCRGN